MKNLDTLNEKKAEILQRMSEAVKSNDTEAFAQAWSDLANNIQDAVMKDAQELIQQNDTVVLAQRGVRQLTSEETKYWQGAIDAIRSDMTGGHAKSAVTLIDETLPKTTINAVFDDLTANHPLLDAINFQNTSALTEILISTTSGVAGWSELTATITDELSGAFAVINLDKKKLSAFIPVANAMLDLGPTWLDQYVRTLLSEALAVELEAGAVDGDGSGKPLGMTRALTGDTGGVFPRKTATAITALDPTTYGTILNTLSQGPNNKRRAIASVLLIVNPADYFTKVFPATTPRTTDGGFNSGVFPFPTTVIQSAAVPEGHAVMGLGPKYFMGLGTGKAGKLEYSDEYKFLEDQRVYRIKLYGNGRALDENAFVYLDISGLVPYVQQVKVTNAADFPTGA
ncbi:phage major capsid protein [Caproiciproducens sp. CPB-2]|uniref:phage major capsid protein n=1 Tax=Caproiciproducens sp. CPB-2 TaxID=3030017 RepID=UPI0023DA9610|nr:phage major capsid protein [Caproiciproducens sp. CPB-2]MDF1495221.1 phage major capsid protein [Caproiciproducens sp. CPB-2]